MPSFLSVGALLNGDGTLGGSRQTVFSVGTNTAGFGLTAPTGCFYSRAACYSSVQLDETLLIDLSSLNGVPNVFVAGRANGAWSYGLVLEEARTNLVLAGRDLSAASWTLFGTATRTIGQSSVFSDSNAYRIQASSGTHGIGETTVSATGATFTTSAWVRSISGTAAPNLNTFRTTAGRIATSTTVGTTWARVTQTLSGSGGETSALVPVDGRDWSGIGGVTAGARDFAVDAAQRELGGFPTEFIPTAGASRTRAASFFGINADRVTPAVSTGRLCIGMHLRAKGARTEFGGTTSLWWIDANNHASFAPSTGVLTIAVGGATNTCTLPSWARLDELRIFVEAGGGLPTRVRYSVNGAAVVDTAITGSTLGSISPAAIYLCSSNAGNHLSCWHYQTNLYRPGFGPAWAGI